MASPWDCQGAYQLAPEDVLVTEFWVGFLQLRAVNIPHEDFLELYLWGKENGFFPSVTDAMSQMVW